MHARVPNTAEILGVQLLELIGPSRREQFAGEFAALLPGTPAAECEVRFLGRPGLTRRVMLHVKRTEAGAGQPIVLVDGVDSATDARSDEARESFNAMLARLLWNGPKRSTCDRSSIEPSNLFFRSGIG